MTDADGDTGNGLDEFTFDPRNARAHPARNQEVIKASLQEFGAGRSILVDGDGIVRAGNGTLEQARALGLKVRVVETDGSELVVVKRSDLTGERAVAAGLADNRSSELAVWDQDALSSLVNESELDLSGLGFADVDLDELLADLRAKPGEGLTDPDDVPEPGEPITKPGDLWLLGEHRLLCGDSTKAENVERVLDGRTPFIMVTDPPYGVEYDATYRSNNRTGAITNDDTHSWKPAYNLFPGVVCYVWHAGWFVSHVATDIDSCGFERRSYILWKKPHFQMGRGHYHWQHEPCWYAARGSSKWCGDRTQSTVWEIAHVHKSLGTTDDGETNHSTQKPVECMARPIRNHGGTDDDVYDPFLGSGTTIIAAEQLHRRCYGLEIDPGYVDICVKRWEDFTGGKAVLQ